MQSFDTPFTTIPPAQLPPGGVRVGIDRNRTSPARPSELNSTGHSEELLRQDSGFKMKCLAATIMAACAWNIVRSEDRGGPNGPMSSKEYTVGGHGKEVVCYWGTWANYRPGNGKFTPEDIDPSLCTNVIYSFAGLDSETNSIKSLGRPGALPASSVAAKFSIHAVIERIQLAAPSNGGAHVELSTTSLTALAVGTSRLLKRT